MGIRMAPAYTNLFIKYLENKLLEIWDKNQNSDYNLLMTSLWYGTMMKWNKTNLLPS